MNMPDKRELFARISNKLKERLASHPSQIQEKKITRVPTGIEGFDKIVSGGFVKNSVVLLMGGAGSGKTIFSIQFLYNGITKFRENGIYISFNESKEDIYRHASLFDFDFYKLEKEKKLGFIKYEPHEVENILKEGGGTIKDLIDEINAKRLVIDSLTSYRIMFENKYKETEAILNLFQLLRKWDLTSLVLVESPQTNFENIDERAAFLADGIILIYYFRKDFSRTRALEVIKMRDTFHLEKICPFTITKKGIVVFTEAQVFGE